MSYQDTIGSDRILVNEVPMTLNIRPQYGEETWWEVLHLNTLLKQKTKLQFIRYKRALYWAPRESQRSVRGMNTQMNTRQLKVWHLAR